MDAEEGTTAADGGDEAAEDDARGLRNQFNFAERTCQTLNYPQREVARRSPRARSRGEC